MDTEEQDRSLTITEVSCSVFQNSYSADSLEPGSIQFSDCILDKEEFPEFSEISHESRSKTSSLEKSEGLKKEKKFLSKSHNSLHHQDYTKVESKVKKYIESLKEQQQNRKKVAPPSVADATPSVIDSARHQSFEIDPQLAEKDVQIAVLQQECDRLLLQNARLKNLVDEMRRRSAPPVPLASERRTNSPPGMFDNQLKRPALTFNRPAGSQDSPTSSSPLTSYREFAVPRSTDEFVNFRSSDLSHESDFSTATTSSWNSSADAQNHISTPVFNTSSKQKDSIMKEESSKARTVASLSKAQQTDYIDSSHFIHDLTVEQLQEVALMALIVRQQTQSLLH